MRHDSPKALLEYLHQLARVDQHRPRYLFRGQNSIFINPATNRASCLSTFHRLPEDEELRAQAFTLYRRAKQICGGLAGYTLRDHLDGVAVLRHYELPAPLIDVTGTPEVAVSFALLKSSPKDQHIVYVIDRDQLPDSVVVVDHDFLTHPLNEGGARARWLRQDGFAVAPLSWQAATPAFDLLSAALKPAIEIHYFPSTSDTELPQLDLLSMTGDPVAARIASVLRPFAKSIFGSLHPELEHRISAFEDAVQPTR